MVPCSLIPFEELVDRSLIFIKYTPTQGGGGGGEADLTNPLAKLHELRPHAFGLEKVLQERILQGLQP